jgi:outer membrane protein assembly factor BamE (lipoprotein component of BamABCDE complex)
MSLLKAKFIAFYFVVLVLSSCSFNKDFYQYNLTNKEVYNSIYINYTNINHIAKLYGKANYKKDDEIWFYSFKSYNYLNNKIEQKLIIIEFNQDGIVADKKIFNYGNYNPNY